MRFAALINDLIAKKKRKKRKRKSRRHFSSYFPSPPAPAALKFVSILFFEEKRRAEARSGQRDPLPYSTLFGEPKMCTAGQKVLLTITGSGTGEEWGLTDRVSGLRDFGARAQKGGAWLLQIQLRRLRQKNFNHNIKDTNKNENDENNNNNNDHKDRKVREERKTSCDIRRVSPLYNGSRQGNGKNMIRRRCFSYHRQLSPPMGLWGYETRLYPGPTH